MNVKALRMSENIVRALGSNLITTLMGYMMLAGMGTYMKSGPARRISASITPLAVKI